MVDLNKQLSRAQGEIPETVRPTADRSSVFIAEGLESAIEGIKAVEDTSATRSFTSELSNIAEQEASFAQEQQKLENELLTAKDKDMINQIHGKLLSLERGERVGSLNPLEAEIRRRALLADAVTGSPWLASDFKSIAAAVRGSGSSSRSASPTPEQAALDDVRERAVKNGLTVAAQREVDAEDSRIARQEAAIKAATNSGQLTFPQARLHILNTSKQAAQSIFAAAFDLVKSDPRALDATDWNTYLSQAKSSVHRRIVAMQSALSETGILLSDNDKDRIQRDMDQEFALVEQFIKSKDKLAYVERTRKIINEEGVLTMSEQNPFFATMVANGAGEKAFDFAFRIWPKYLGAAQRHGSFDAIERLGELGDVDALVFLQAVKFNKGQYGKGLYNKFRNGEDTGNKYIDDLLMTGMAASILRTNPEGPDDAEMSHMADMAHKRLMSAGNPKELENYLDPTVVRNTKKNKKALKDLESVVNFRTRNAVSAAPISLVTETAGKPIKTHSIIYDATSKTFKVLDHRDKILQKQNPDRPIRLTESAVSESLTRMLKLKTMYGMFDGGSREAWIGNILDEVNREIPQDVTDN